MNDKKKKRKAQLSYSEDENEDAFDADYSPSNATQQNLSQRVMRESNQPNSRSQGPNAFVEKRKKVSQNFEDLSKLNDLDGASQQTNCGIANGIIEKITLKNFKCHSWLEFEFHPYINFILGRNGSGKSAVMDAIILCLGGRATATGRQASAKTFIKTNSDKGEVSITLRNEGEEAYKPKDYGSRITIERRITSEGASYYRVLNDKHKLISNKKQEIDNIVEQFNIQVDNPVCFLNQETSKHFLNSSNKTDKYKLFMKASQLDSMKRLQEEIEHQRQISLEMIRDKEAILPKLEEDLFQLEDKYKKCQSVEVLRKKLNNLMHECSWSLVISFEKKVDESKKEKLVIVKSREKHERKLEETAKCLDDVTLAYDEAKRKINQATERNKSYQDAFEKVNDKFKKSAQNYKMFQVDLKKLNIMHEKKSKEYEALVEKLNEEKKNTQKDYEVERRQKETKLNSIKEKQVENAKVERFKNQENQMYSSAIEHAQKTINDKKFNCANLEKTIRNFQTDIENLKNASKDQIFRFGKQMPDLVNEVKLNFERGNFKQMPRGPIGCYIQPKEHKYSLAIEQCIGPLIKAFICGNYDDERLMHQLINKHIKEVDKKPRVIVTNFNQALYDVSQYRPEFTEYPTVLEMLSIRDPIIANTLIDQRRVESVLLLPDREVGREIIERNSTQNCSEAFLINGDQLLGRPSFRLYACRFKQPAFFLENTQATIEHKKNEISKLTQSLLAVRVEIEDLHKQITSNKTLKSQNDKQLDEIRRLQMKLNFQMKEVEAINIPEPVDLVVFEEEIDKLKSEMDELKGRIGEVEASSAEFRAVYDKAYNERAKCEMEMKANSEGSEEIVSNYKASEERRSELLEAVKHYKNALNEIVSKENEKERQISVQEEELKKLIRAATELSPRVETKRNNKTIESEIQNVERQIQATEKLHGNEEEITRKYLEMRNKYKIITDDIKKQNTFLNKLKGRLEKRQEAMNLFTQSKALRCAMDFNNYLRSRNYNGSLKFDHAGQKLDVIVHPNKSKESSQSHDLKSLSGGERSFSTVAFLLSLWSIVESPILFLDEFDVFMDQINRRFAMELILSSAKEKLNGQYVFLTPQEMGYIKPDEHVKLFKMPDPKRLIDMEPTNRNNNEED